MWGRGKSLAFPAPWVEETCTERDRGRGGIVEGEGEGSTLKVGGSGGEDLIG